MRKKIAFLTAPIISLLISFILPVSTAFADGPTLALSPATGTFNKGCNFTLTINVDTAGVQTDGTDVILFYDPTRLTANQINNGTIYSEYPGNSIDPQAGKITISGLASVSSPFTGSGVLATVDFSVLPNAPSGLTQAKFNFDPLNKGLTTDSNIVQRGTVTDVLNQVVNGGYTIGTGSCAVQGGPGVGGPGVGGPSSATPSATVTVSPVKTLPVSGSFETTQVLAIVGGALIVLGALGLAIL